MMKLAELYTSSLPTPLPQKIQILGEYYGKIVKSYPINEKELDVIEKNNHDSRV